MSPADKVRETVTRWPASARYIAFCVTVSLLLQIGTALR